MPKFHNSGRRSVVLRMGATATLAGAIALTGASQPPATTSAGLAWSALASYRSPVGQAAVIPPGSRSLGMAAATTPIRVDVVLQPRDQAALHAFASAVSTPGTPQYRHFLVGGQFASIFGPTSEAIMSVTAYLRIEGLTPGTITSDHLIIPVETTVGGLERALHLTMSRYVDTMGSTALANNQAPTLPASLSSEVQGIVGLDTFPTPVARPATTHVVARAAAAAADQPKTSGPTACKAAAGEANHSSGWTYTQLASAYGFNKLYAKGDLGSGAAIAVFEEQSYSSADIAAFQACYKTDATVSNVSVDGGNKDADFSPEAVLDIETVIGLAPKAKVLVYETTGTSTGAIDGYDAIVTQHKAQVITSSWSSEPFSCDIFVPTAVLNAENAIFEEAAAKGISTFVATGDVGSAGCMANGGTRELSTGTGPDAVAIDPSTHTLYEANFYSGSVTVVNEVTLSVVATLNLGRTSDPAGVAVDQSSDKVYVSEEGSGDVLEINGATCDSSSHSKCSGTRIALGSGTEPDGIAVDPVTGTVYVAALKAGAIGVISEKTEKLVGAADGGSSPTDVSIDDTANDIFFTDAAIGGGVGILVGADCDAENQSDCPTSLTEVEVSGEPISLVVDHALRRIYVTDLSSDKLTVINEAHGGIVANINLEDSILGPTDVALAPEGTSVLVAGAGARHGEGSGVAVVSTKTNSVTRVIPGGDQPAAVASDPSLDYAWVADVGFDTKADPGGLVWLPLLLSVEDPSGQPFVTGVGGTDLTKLGPAPRESVWNGTLSGSGAGTGGISADWTMPSYQSGPGVISKLSSGAPCGATSGHDCRELPDVAASADPAHGYVIIYQGKWTSVGGTSGAAPLWAALIALVDVSAKGGKLDNVGFINPALYKLVAAGKHVVNDVTRGNDDYTTTNNGLYPATSHYDMATGLGSPVGGTLATDLG